MVAARWWQPQTRLRIANNRHTGLVLQWTKHFGWIAPDVAIDHPEAYKHNWRIYVNLKDVDSGEPLCGGARVSFFAYCDGNGIGAEEVRLEDDDMGGSAASEALQEDAEAEGGPGGGIHLKRPSLGKGSNLGVQRTIEKPLLGAGAAANGVVKVKGKGKGKGKSKELLRALATKILKGQPKDGGRGGGAAPAPGPGSGPDRNKTTHVGEASVLHWACSEMRGWRPAMEDASCAILGLDAPLSSQAMFAVFDGHGGSAVSRRASQDLPAEVVAIASDLASQGWNNELAAGDAEGGLPGRALKAALPSLDAAIRAAGEGQEGFLPMSSCGGPIPSDVRNAFALTGSTAVVALLECDGPPEVSRPLRVVVANIGDSRAILCRGGEAIALSEDHKPDDPAETERIEKAGGFVGAVGPCMRIDGWGLNLSRALGDFHYKAREDLPPGEQKVSVVPDICAMDITEEDEFLLLCCDGVFELHSSQEAVDHVRQKMQAGSAPAEAAESLADASCSPDLMQTQGRGSDNVSVMVVLLR